MSIEGSRREEILQTSARLFASSGLRTSLEEIADACGILPGSLYHHFASKEAIIVELAERYRDDLDRTAKEALDRLDAPEAKSVEDQIIEFGEAIAACAIRHRAALLLTLYDPPTVAGERLTQVARQTPSAVDAAMLRILDAGRSAGAIRGGVDLPMLAERIVQSMLHIAVGISHRGPGGERMPAIRCGVLLHGVAAAMPAKSTLDRSPAMKAARQVVDEWEELRDVDDDRFAHLLAVARTEFGKRGYEATTIRDIGAAAGLSTGTVYRMVESKDELLASIMETYVETVTSTWNAVLRSRSSPLEQLDALTWANIMLLERFGDEYRIHLAWLRQSPPSTVDLGATFPKQLRQIKALLAAGTGTGELRVEGPSADIRASSVTELLWTPETIIRAMGPRRAHALARDTVLRGAARPRKSD
jgi:AcrR family transcriptional regulator